MNWVQYFERNRANRKEMPWNRTISIAPQLREPLIHSLQRFQIGESGEGKHMKRCAAATGDAEYAQAVHLFIAEEQEHARMMMGILERLGAKGISRHWSDAGFILLRRLFGLNCEVMVMLAAEIVGKRYFQTLYQGMDDPLLRAVFGQMVQDEDGHIAFQSDRLKKVFSSLPRFVLPFVRGLWRVVYEAAFFVVVYDHRHLLRALCVSPAEFMRECNETYNETTAVMFGVGGALIPAMDMRGKVSS